MMLQSLESLPIDESDKLVALFNRGCYIELEGRARILVEKHPESGLAWKALGASLQMQGKEALPALQRAAELLSDDASAQSNLGRALRDIQQLDAARMHFRRALEIKPDLAEAHNNLGATLQDLGQLDEAATCYRRALEINPDFTVAHHNLGVTLHDLGHPADAVASFWRALEIEPEFAEAHSNLGSALRDLGRLVEAEACYRRALVIKPDFAVAHNRLGVTLRNLRQLDAAVASHRRALEIKPDYVSAHNNLGVVLRDLGELDAAVACYHRALEIDPQFFPAHISLGVTLEDLWRLDDAVASFRRAFEINPESTRVSSNLVGTLHYLADQSAPDLLVEARRFGDLATRQARAYTDWFNIRDCDRCLRVGMVSPDLRDHPVGYFLESILAALALNVPGRLEIIAYMTNIHTDAATERIKANCYAWRSVLGFSDESLARQIRDDGIDILIDLSGHTAHNRLPLFAWKPAPLQVSWLGYSATTGLAAIDYVLADPWVLPEADEPNFMEKIWRLPETRLCFTPPGINVDVAPLPALENDYIIFGCFNNLSKINAGVIALWARILLAVPGSRLFLKTRQLGVEIVRQRFLNCFAANGIAAAQLIMEGLSPRAEYLTAYQRVDIALDPFPFPGGTTTVESLWMGVPVLTLAGTSFLSRQGVGLLMNAGLSDWIATDADDYVARAVSHASNLTSLASLRDGLRQQVLNTPLFDAPRFAGHFEAALRGMWIKWCSEQPVTVKEKIAKPSHMKTFLHVGCGSSYKDQTTRGFNALEWKELRLDINEAVNPDIVGTMLDMSAVADESVNALFSSHNIEHLYPHEVPLALAEFRRVLKSDGFVVITCPDLQSVCQLIADDKLTEPAYISPAGPIAPLDILYGLRSSLRQGNEYMAHRCGFTERVLIAVLQDAGFGAVVSGSRAHPFYDLWVVASKGEMAEKEMAALAEAHFPD